MTSDRDDKDNILQEIVEWARRAAKAQRAIEARGPMEHTILPIPLRDGEITVRVQGLPHDLTPAEADKIVAVIKAYVIPRPNRRQM